MEIWERRDGRVVWRICERIWTEEGWPEEWKERVIVPIVKKESEELVKEYRG